KGLAQLGAELIVESLDRGDRGARAGERVGDAGAGRGAVDQHRAGAANAVLAAEMRAGEVQRVAQEVAEMRPRLDLGGNGPSVDGERNRAHGPTASSTARLSATTWIWRSIGSFMPASCIRRSATLGWKPDARSELAR